MRRHAPLIVALVSLAACHPGYHVGVMARLDRQGRYAEALERALRIEPDVPAMPLDKQAHYCIYRGVAHLALGQIADAQLWLGRAVQYRTSYPGLITIDHGMVLEHALAQLRATPTMVVAPPPPAVAVPAP
jgi:hypothetical protein